MNNSKLVGALAFLGALSLVGCNADTTTYPARPGYGPADQQKMRDQIQAEIDAKHFTTETWSLDDGSGGTTEVSFLDVASLRLVISASCLQPSGKLSCAALDGLLVVPGKAVVEGPGTPAAYYCAPAGGEGADGTGPNGAGGQEGFCQFGDGSVIDTWTLVYTPDTVFGTNEPE